MTTIRRALPVATALPVAIALVAVAALASGGVTAAADEGRGGDDRSVRVELSGYQETPASLSTAGTGELRLRIDEDEQEIAFSLSYADLEGEGKVLQAHIHFGATATSGGISTFLCSNLTTPAPPAGTAACPASPGTVSGVLDAADVIGPAAQGIAAGELDELLAAISADTAYVNVHSSLYGTGEIRGQLDGDDHDDDHDD